MSVGTHSSSAPICEIDLFGTASLQDPVAVYRHCHSLGPVVWLKHQGIHAICGFETLTETLRNHRIFRSGEGVSIDPEVNKLLVGSTLNSDPPQHDLTRSITFNPLTPKALATVREKIETEAEGITDFLVNRGEFDAAAELAPHVPLSVVRDLVGLGDHGKEHMLSWGGATFELMGDPRERRSKAVDNLKQMRKFLEDPKTLDDLKEDGWAKTAILKGLEQGLGKERANELMRDYIAPSLDTTISAIGYGVMLFAQHPEQWEKIRCDRSLIRNAIEEIVRLNTPIRTFTRFVEEDATVANIPIEKGSRIMMMYGAANRDPKRFEDPDGFDVERKVRGHVGFGHGVHACLGMHLARLEMTCLFEALANRVKRFELSGPIEPSVNSTIHSLARVPVRTVSC